jgi:hypothetical protein
VVEETPRDKPSAALPKSINALGLRADLPTANSIALVGPNLVDDNASASLHKRINAWGCEQISPWPPQPRMFGLTVLWTTHPQRCPTASVLRGGRSCCGYCWDYRRLDIAPPALHRMEDKPFAAPPKSTDALCLRAQTLPRSTGQALGSFAQQHRQVGLAMPTPFSRLMWTRWSAGGSSPLAAAARWGAPTGRILHRVASGHCPPSVDDNCLQRNGRAERRAHGTEHSL